VDKKKIGATIDCNPRRQKFKSQQSCLSQAKIHSRQARDSESKPNGDAT